MFPPVVMFFPSDNVPPSDIVAPSDIVPARDNVPPSDNVFPSVCMAADDYEVESMGRFWESEQGADNGRPR